MSSKIPWTRYFKRRAEQGVLFVIAGAFMGSFMLSAEFSWWGVLGGMISGAVFFGIPVLLPRTWLDDRGLRAGFGAIAGAAAAAAGYWFGEDGESLQTWILVGAVIGGMFLWYDEGIWRDWSDLDE